jgi:hypothetical protein
VARRLAVVCQNARSPRTRRPAHATRGARPNLCGAVEQSRHFATDLCDRRRVLVGVEHDRQVRAALRAGDDDRKIGNALAQSVEGAPHKRGNVSAHARG